MKAVLASVALMISAISPAIYANGQFSSVDVVAVRVDNNGKGLVFFSGTPTGTRPSCLASGFQNHLAFDASTPGGRAILATLLTAKATGQKITASGSGTCAHYGIAEDWWFGNIE